MSSSHIINSKLSISIENGNKFFFPDYFCIDIFDGNLEIKFIILNVLAIPMKKASVEIANDWDNSIATKKIAIFIKVGSSRIEFIMFLVDELLWLFVFNLSWLLFNTAIL